MLTFIDERRQRIRKAREEGRREIIRILSLDPRMDALFREDPKIREIIRGLGVEPPSRGNCDA